jgi:hypothetical protein
MDKRVSKNKLKKMEPKDLVEQGIRATAEAIIAVAGAIDTYEKNGQKNTHRSKKK